MATLLDSVTETVTPHMAEQFGTMLGVEQAQILPGITKTAPVVLAALGAKTATTEQADEVLASLKDDTVTAADARNPADAIADGRSHALLSRLFGVGASKMASWIQDTTGFDVAPFLPLAAPLVWQALQNAVKQENLDSAGLTGLLKKENDAYARANPQLASEINAALDVGENVNERAARIREKFSPEEWNTLARTPALAGYAVMMSALSGPIGLNKEISALLEAMAEYGQSAEPDSLIGLVSREFHSPEQINTLGANRSNALNLARDACLEALRILNEKDTYEEALEYKEFVVNVATHVAQAAIDGGIMSIGGTPVSPEEQMTLDLIAAALAYQP